MSSKIDTIRDFKDILDQEPVELAEVRSRILTRDLLAVPEDIKGLKKDVTELKAGQERLEGDVTELKEDVTELKGDVTELKEDVTELKGDVAELKEDVTGLKKDVTKLKKDVGHLKDGMGELRGNAAETAALREVKFLPLNMGMAGTVRQLDRGDVYKLANSWDWAGIPKGDIQSFRKADVILEAQDETGQACYVAVEISYTVNGRDTHRALRNAGFLTRFTGKPARAAVMGVRIDERIRDLIETGEVHCEEIGVQAH